MRVVRLPWLVAGAMAALCHLPLLLIEIELTVPPSPDELSIDLETFLPEPEPEPEPEPREPRPPEPPPDAVEEPPPEALEQPLPEELPSDEEAPPPEPTEAEPAPSDEVAATPTTPDSADPTDKPRPIEPPPPPPPPPPRNPFDPRAYRDLAFALVDRQKRYPRKARVLGLQGTVTLMVYLDEDGNLMREPRVHKSSGHDVLDEEAVRMVKAAAPFPKPEGEVTRVPIIVPLAINFRLQDP